MTGYFADLSYLLVNLTYADRIKRNICWSILVLSFCTNLKQMALSEVAYSANPNYPCMGGKNTNSKNYIAGEVNKFERYNVINANVNNSV